MKPFNAERALAGDPVVTESGLSVTQFKKLILEGGVYYLCGVIADRLYGVWDRDGYAMHHFIGKDMNLKMVELEKNDNGKIKRWTSVCSKDKVTLEQALLSILHGVKKSELQVEAKKFIIEWEEEV